MKTSLRVPFAKTVRLVVLLAGVIFTFYPPSAQAGWIGMIFQRLTFDVEKAKSIGLSEAGPYLRVQYVLPGTPAEKAGLKKGDIIWEYDKRRYSDNRKLFKAIGKTPPGETVPIVVLRDWQFRTMQVTLGTRPIQPSQARYDHTRCKDVRSQFRDGSLAMLMAQKPDDFLAAAKIYGTAIERQSGDQRCTAVYYNHGVALEKAYRYKAAKKSYEDFIKYAPKSADIAAVKDKIANIEALSR